MKAFKMLADAPQRLPITGRRPDRVALAAGMDRPRSKVTLLAANFSSRAE
jgi:hypothetical protein